MSPASHHCSMSGRCSVRRCGTDATGGAGRTLGRMVRRMDNVGIVVEDLEATVAFFQELGLELEGGGVIEGEWAGREWTRGAYNANFGPCGWLHFGDALARPIGPIKWASTETAVAWSGYMEGAVEAGTRAAREVLDDLDRAR